MLFGGLLRRADSEERAPRRSRSPSLTFLNNCRPRCDPMVESDEWLPGYAMAENEAILLERFSTRADPEAFAELVRRYVRLVYSTSWRVLKEEVAAHRLWFLL